ncbi:pentatricopeptide repeat-containing protein At3g22150, chloroplastic [Cucurbita pepo subsp. pepo]|uniref:pentatricopeptide repeat-containing protein At3g22150, chloroplastic n=1 Tax=Cucurbita pepo subsp. pepo TaxID=3664 RepID=UPI000C9D671F|nr:pentatricopeptide repeat-containing protein At3g22150, chloroplastic [Cucurbita pepo subsp. pepo]
MASSATLLSFSPLPSNPPLHNHSTNPKIPTIRYRLSRLCQEGQLHLARQLFDTLPRPSTVLWNTIIIGLVCNNFPDEALLFYSNMKSSSPEVKCDSYTYSSILKACADTRNLVVGKAVHAHFLRCLMNPSRIVHNSLLNMYSMCLSTTPDGKMAPGHSGNDLVRKVFDTMRKRTVVAWNTLIAWYVRTERYAEAVKQFRLMLKLGIKPSPVSFVNVFPALSCLRNLKKANVVHGMLVKFGSEYVNDLYVVSSAIFMYAELGRLECSKKVFDSCLERNTEVWNTMISAYVQNNCPFEGIQLFLQAMESEDAALDEVTLLSAIAAVSHLQTFELAEQLHAFVVKNVAVSQVCVMNALIAMYSRCNSTDVSFKIFDYMPEKDVVSWNTMISAFVQNGLNDEALMLFYEMQKQGMMIDSVAVTALLSAASDLRNPNIGKQTHGYLLRNGIQFEGMDSYLIDMYAKSGLIEAAQNVFEKSYSHERDQATWNAMMSGYTQNGLVHQAFLVLRQMLDQKITPNVVTLASILPACNPSGYIDWGKQLHGFSIRNDLDQNVFVATALIDMYSKSGSIANAENVFRKASERSIVTYSTMILGYGQHGMGESALSMFHTMQKSGIRPDAVTFVAILSACSYSGLVDEGLQIFESMRTVYNIQPSTEHFCCVADMLGRVGRVDEAYEFVVGLGEQGNAMEIWGSLLAACRIHKQFELGKVVAKKLLEMEKRNGKTGYHVLLSNIYAEERNWENVDIVRKQMKERGLKKETGSSWIEIAGYMNHFASKDRKHPQSDQIYNMLEELLMEMKHAGYKPQFTSYAGGLLETDE